MRRKIVVTGSNGQLGSEIKDLSTASGHQFHFTDVDQLDLTNKEETERYFNTISPDYIINCAAYTAVDDAETNEAAAFKVNVGVPEILVDYAKRQHVRLIHISTDYVFPGNNPKPLKESDPTGPASVYGKTKLLGEKAIEDYQQTLIIRTSWLYSVYGKNFVKTMVSLMAEKEELRVVNDQTGNPTYARDLAKAILSIIGEAAKDKDPFRPGLYHYSNEGAVSWYELALEIKKYIESSCKVNAIETKDYPLPASRPKFSILSKEKIKKDFGLEVPFWKDSLKDCLYKLTDN